MIVYQETVRLPRLMSPVTEVVQIVGVLGLLGLLYWSEFRGGDFYGVHLSPVGPCLLLAVDALPALMMLNAIVFPELDIQIDDTSLLLRRGFFRKTISLDSVVEAISVAASAVRRTTVTRLIYMTSDFLFLDRRRSTNLRVLLSGGHVRYIATARPDELIHALSSQTQRSRRATVLSMIATHTH